MASYTGIKKIKIGDNTFTLDIPTKVSELLNDNGYISTAVTSVAVSGNNGITISGSPITSTGTITVGLNLSTAINGLGEGTSQATLDDYAVVQYAGGGTTTTTYHRRKLRNLVVGHATTADSATTAITATQDSGGNTIATTYLKLSGGTMTGNVTFDNEKTISYKQVRKKSDGGGWAYAPFRFIGNDNAAFGYIGAYGGADTLTYIYIGANDYNGNNLRIYPTGLISSTASGNTVTIGSQNASFTHIYNSASIPFIFNNSVLTTTGNLGNSTYPFNNLYIGKANGSGIYYTGSKSTNRMIRFLENTTDAYGNGIAIGGGGTTIIGGGESADTIVSNVYSGANGAEVMVVASDGNIELYPGQNTYDASAHHSITNNGIWAGVSDNTTREIDMGVRSGAGQMYMWSAAATNGARGIWLPAHGSGTAHSVFTVDTNNNVTFYGTLSGNATSATNATMLTSQGRLTTADNLRGDGKVRFTIASSSMTTNKPLFGGLGAAAATADGLILELPWDNTGGYDTQLAIRNNGTGLSIRGGTGKNGSAQIWSSWAPVAMASAAISNITRSGTTFTATRANGTTFTFTQQDTNTNTVTTLASAYYYPTISSIAANSYANGEITANSTNITTIPSGYTAIGVIGWNSNKQNQVTVTRARVADGKFYYTAKNLTSSALSSVTLYFDLLVYHKA